MTVQPAQAAQRPGDQRPGDPRHDDPRTAPWLIVARREIIAKLTDRTFIVGTVLSLALISGFMGIQVYMTQRTQSFTVAVIAADHAMADKLAAQASTIDDKVKVTVREVPAADAAKSAVMAGDADVWLHHDGTPPTWVLTGREDVDTNLAQAATLVVRQAVTTANAQAAGTDIAVIERGATLQTALLVGDAEKQGFAKAMGFVLAMLFYMSSLAFGFIIAGSVVEEKASRLVEIIATRIPIRSLLVGKVVGNTVMAMAQMAIYVGVGLAGLSATRYSALIPGISAGVGWFLAFYLVGFLLLACLWAVAGSLASRNEDLQQVSMPLTMSMVAVFFSAFLAKGTVLVWLSFVPPFSSVLMPIRLLQGTAAWWEPWVALVILLAASAAVIVVAERLYRRALLQTQGRLSVRAAWSMAE